MLTQGSESFVTRCIKQSNRPPLVSSLISRDMLSDATRLSLSLVHMENIVQQSRLAMVNMTHHGNDGRTRLSILTKMNMKGLLVGHAGVLVNHPYVNPQLTDNYFSRLEVNPLIDCRHDTVLKQLTNQLDYRDTQLVGKVTDRHHVRQL